MPQSKPSPQTSGTTDTWQALKALTSSSPETQTPTPPTPTENRRTSEDQRRPQLPRPNGELTMANCTTYLYNDPRLGCALPSGHDGPTVTGSGRGWHDSDGGVAAALIGKEAEESPSVDYEAMWWDAERRAKEAEDRADDAHNLIVALRADLAATETRAEQAERERDRWHSMWRQRAIKH